MNDDLEPSAEDAERWAAALLRKSSKAERIDPAEQAMIEKVFGSKTEAEQFFRHQGRLAPRPGASRIDMQRRPTFKPRAPVVHYEYYDRPSDSISLGGWGIEYFENGRKIRTETGSDYAQRDALLIRYEAAGFTCKPVTIGDVPPMPIEGRARDRRRKPSGRFDIIAQIGKLTTEDLDAIELEEDDYWPTHP